ncbi:MAG: esterase/lipase family protein [Rhizobiaceae bacterium]
MSKTTLLIHGAWLTPAIWKPWIDRYEAQGHTVAPAWPFMDRPVAELRRALHPELGKLTLGKIVDHYAAIMAAQPEKPILIGHSYGGLIVQMLRERGRRFNRSRPGGGHQTGLERISVGASGLSRMARLEPGADLVVQAVREELRQRPSRNQPADRI